MADQLKPPTKQSYWFYALIVAVLFFGYAVGGALAFGVFFLNWFPQLTSPAGRLTVTMFGMGMIGATLYCTQWWAMDVEEAIEHPKYLPHFFDAFGYATTIVGGGISGVVFFLALRVGSAFALSNGSLPTIRPSAALIVAFCGGLAQFKINKWLRRLADKWMKSSDGDDKSSGARKDVISSSRVDVVRQTEGL